MSDYSNKTTDRSHNIYHRRAMLIFIIIGIGIVLFFVLLEFLLRMEARRNQDENNNRFFMSTISNLNSNTKEIDKFIGKFHKNNGIMLNNLAVAFSNDSYRRLSAMSQGTQQELLKESMTSIDGCSNLLIINGQGDIIMSTDSAYIGSNVVSNETIDISQDELEKLYDGTYEYVYKEDQETLTCVYCKTIPGSYGVDGHKYILLFCSSDILDRALERMYDLSAWLNGSTIGNNGFVLMVDEDTDRVLYGNVGGEDKEYVTASSLGIDKNILTDRYTGTNKIGGVSCYVSTRAFHSEDYGQDDYLIACIPTDDLYGGNFPVVLWNLCLLSIFLILLAAYSSFVRSEMLRTGEEQLRVRLLSLKGNTIYYSRTLGRKIIPIVFTSVILIFLSALYIQALMKLSGAFSESVAIEEEISRNVEESVNIQNDFTNYYDMQNVSRAKLMAFIIGLNGDQYFDFSKESEGVMPLGNADGSGNRDAIRDDYNNVVNVINNSKVLEKLRDANNVKNIYLISDAGYTLATSSDYWSFSLSNNVEDQSYEFWDVIDGRRDTIVQLPMISDEGNFSQFIGCAFNYYTCLDDDKKTKFVKYTDFLKQSKGDYTGNLITKHRGLIQIEMDPEDKNNVIDSAKPEYILSNTRISNDGFLIGFVHDEIDDVYNVFYSGISSMVGKNADELGISKKAFSGNYNGFQSINGKRYLQSFRPVEGYYIATAMPTDKLYYGCFVTAMFCAAFGFVLMFILSFYTLLIRDMDSDELYREEHDPLAIFGHWEASKNWINSTPTQKFEMLIKKALLLGGAVFLAAIIYEAYRYGSNSAIVYILSNDWDRGIHIFSVSAAIVMMILVGLFIRAFEHVINLIAAAFGSRVETMMHLFTSLIKTTLIISVVFYSLFIMGIEATRLLASAGILSIGLSFGAQNLIGDLLAGIFIVMEGSVHVGDYVMIDGVRGKVKEIGLRTTRYEDDNQNIRIICNNELKSFANMSMKYSVVYYDIPVPYNEDYVRIRNILNKEFLGLYEKNSSLKGIPVCQGIEEFSESSVDMRVKFMCAEEDRYDVQRFMHDNIMRIFMENDITIPFNQLDVHYEAIQMKE
ncbi:MAG: mechanosensitive ion channel family protein [Lachnospiraceae bacterium]|nr:mechanosensitive ion channel family protein [Lachnospiraceae bacterium]